MSDSDLWVWQEPGLFRLSEYVHDGASAVEEGEDECVEESLLTFDGGGLDHACGTSSGTLVDHKQSSEKTQGPGGGRSPGL